MAKPISFASCRSIPAFTGWEYERYVKALQQVSNVVGASVWCQTGGWGKFRRRTDLEDSSIWVELNAFVTVQLCRGTSCEESVRQFSMQRIPAAEPQSFLQFLRLADEVIQELIYIREMAERTLYHLRHADRRTAAWRGIEVVAGDLAKLSWDTCRT